ncbi:3-methyl-2-oxobutanoate hydroxymethyltransferase [compost metagenome]
MKDLYRPKAGVRVMQLSKICSEKEQPSTFSIFGRRTFSQAVTIPVIGIGAGPGTDGQVLVLHDMLGLSLSTRRPRFVRNFMSGQPSIAAALQAYVAAVKEGLSYAGTGVFQLTQGACI